MNKPAYPYPKGTNTWIDDWPFVATVGEHDVYGFDASRQVVVIPKGHKPYYYWRDGAGTWRSFADNHATAELTRPPDEVYIYVEALHQLTR